MKHILRLFTIGLYPACGLLLVLFAAVLVNMYLIKDIYKRKIIAIQAIGEQFCFLVTRRFMCNMIFNIQLSIGMLQHSRRLLCKH